MSVRDGDGGGGDVEIAYGLVSGREVSVSWPGHQFVGPSDSVLGRMRCICGNDDGVDTGLQGVSYISALSWSGFASMVVSARNVHGIGRVPT